MTGLQTEIPDGTRVVNIRSGQQYDIYIGRPSKWGNPFKIGRDGTRSEVIEKYRDWAAHNHTICESLYEIKGKTLACYCKPQACHGDVLVEMIEELDQLDPDWAQRLFEETSFF